MSNKFYTPGPNRAAAVEDLFGIIAPRYDLINDLQSLGLHRRWKSKLIDLAVVNNGDRALDICCGTGDIALGLHQRGARVTGLDFSPAMLEIAHRRCQSPGEGSSPQFFQGDAMNLPFADRSFDIVTVGYGLRNLASWERGVDEMWRVATPGARILALDFGKPENPLWRAIYNGYLRFGVPLFGKLFCRDSATHSYIYESLRHYPAQRGVARKMEALGCRNVKIHNVLGGAMSINFGVKS
jgi:demethylmenaquinone methyltransferase/2-methoxy-6-polyprenyl-1,4-benzoquinol methylase